ncbi:MAG: tetratricopeptide repeat protein, partial [Deltaproteobacteria bacterium]|nr:tetratricopeptide repeat protein [Deltaproteobacteria bacterium]
MSFDEALARGSDALKQGKLDQAQRSFRIALDQEPGNTRVLALLGLTYFRGNQFDEARPIYEQLVDKAPTDPSHRLNLGLVYLKVNESEKAIGSLEASRALDPSQGRAISYLGLAYARAGRYAEAYRSFLLAGQNELASEIEINLTAPERDGINAQLGRSPRGPVESAAPTAPPYPADAATQPLTIVRTPGQEPPRTKPPSAPPKPGRTPSQEFAQQLSHPEIVIEKLTASSPSVPMVPARSGASIPDAPPVALTPLFSDSMQFILPKSDGAPQVAHDGVSMISQAVAAAAPSTTASAPERTKSGGTPPRPLSELATDELVRPEDGDEPFEIAPNGALVIRVSDRVLTRLDGVHVTGGDLSYEVAMRRSRGHQTEDRFDYGGTPLHSVSGEGYLVAVPGTQTFHAVLLDDDILYLREDLVFAFEASLRWESGNVPGLRGKLPVVQFRGDGALVLRVSRPLVRVKLPAQGVVYVDADRLAGWIGRVIPRAVV